MTDRQMTIIQTWVFGRHFIENEKVSLSLTKITVRIYC